MRQVQKHVHAIVKLMVAWDGQIITHEVHHVHYTSPLGQCGDGAALNGIASIRQKHPVGAVLRLKPLLIAGPRGVVVQAGMDIVGMEDYNGSLLVRPSRQGSDDQPQQQNGKQTKPAQLLHRMLLSLIISPSGQRAGCILP